ncbi:MAG: penicillin-binding protein 2 [Candidatus Omnitrophica bacterium]|nr:penicillin-binding protein 2 [Candidatus Omnitrophota bacterium]
MLTRRISLIIASAFLLVSARLFYLQIILGEKFSRLSETNSIRVLRIQAARGRILDRNFSIIADNQFSYDLLVYPQRIDSPDHFLEKLSKILDIPFLELKKNFEKQKIYPALPLTLIRDIDKRKAIILEELKFGLPGISIQKIPKRHYPYGRLASHILGYLSSIDWWRLNKWQSYGYSSQDIVGYGGVEERYDYYLKGQDGGVQLEVDNRGRPRRILGFKSARKGRDICLTIDLKIQKIVEECLKGYEGAVIIMDPHSGEIMAMASAPDFSPAEFSCNPSVLKKALLDPRAVLVNRAISGLYPPGSVFKPVVATAGLQTKHIDTKTSFFCDGSIKIGDREFSCWDKHGYENIKEAITHSCNIFFYRLGLSLGVEKINEFALKFGLGRSTQIDLPEEKPGFVPQPFLRRLTRRLNWFEGDTANFSIGQGELLVTPLQIVRMISVFANKGKLVRPYIVKSIDGKDVSLQQRMITWLNIEEKILKILDQSMRAVVEESEGTAHIMYIPSISVAGKTGTAQVAHRQPHAWFAGYFPIENPRYSICVVLDNAGSSTQACLVAKNIIKRMNEESLL